MFDMAAKQELAREQIPQHIAIIMDGNGRWAKNRNLPRLMGHKAGATSVKKVVEAAAELGVSALTLYAFSTENWKRPALEVQGLMALLKTYLASELANMLANNISLRCLGQIEALPDDVAELLRRGIKETAGNTGMVLSLALNYGGRAEIVMAARKIAEKCQRGEITSDQIDEEFFAEHLFTAGLPDPDLVIRTGGESRLSNFLLWQLSYAEIYITEIFWPEFNRESLIEAIRHFQGRQRRFGKTGEQIQA